MYLISIRFLKKCVVYVQRVSVRNISTLISKFNTTWIMTALHAVYYLTVICGNSNKSTFCERKYHILIHEVSMIKEVCYFE